MARPPTQDLPFWLRQRFKFREVSPQGSHLKNEVVRGTKAAAAAMGVSVLYLKRMLAENGDDTFSRVVRYDDGTWVYRHIERLDRIR